MIQMNLPMKPKQTHRHREQACGCQRGVGWRRDAVGGWYQQMQTIIYRVDKQGTTIMHREPDLVFVINRSGKEHETECVYMYKRVTFLGSRN